jgi:hypothetical protein
VQGMIATFRSRLGGMGSRQGDGSSSPAELVHDANAAKANTANFHGCSCRQHSYGCLFPALVDAPIVVSLRAKRVCGKISHTAGHLRSLQCA